MALIIAIVLILIITIKIGSEKQKTYKTDIHIFSALQENDRIKLLAKDEKLELSVRENLRDPNKHDEIIKELNEVFSQLPSCSSLDAFLFYPEKKYSIEYSMALRILMAKRGKIPDGECWCNGSHSGTMFLPPQTSERSRQLRKCFKELMSWVETELQKHGLPVRLAVIVSPAEYDPKFSTFCQTGREFYWDEYKKTLDCPNASTDSIRGFIWKLK